MSVFKFKKASKFLTTLAYCLGATVAAHADQIVSQTNFQLPTNLGTAPMRPGRMWEVRTTLMSRLVLFL